MNLTLPGLFLLALLLAWPAPARADCANPAADAASIVYNTDHSVMQYCNGSYWVAMGSGGEADTLDDLSCASGQVAKYDGSAWACAADDNDGGGGGGGSGTEVAFSVTKGGSDQTVSSATWTKLTWSTEEFDTNDDFASDRFAPTVAGRYLITAAAYCSNSTAQCNVYIYRNGSGVKQGYQPGAAANPKVTAEIDMNGSSDYLEVYAYNSGGTTISGSTAMTYFAGHLIGGGGGGGTDTLSSLSCTSGQVAKWNGSAWACANENAAAGQEVAFHAHKNGTNQTVTASTWTVVTWPTESFDTNGNLASNAFTPTVAGKYLINANVYCQSGAGTACHVAIRKNGTFIAYDVERAAQEIATVSTIVDMNGSTDYIDVMVHHTDGTVIWGGAEYTTFSGALISPDGAGAAGDSVWDLSGSNAYYNDGNVGIGTSSPSYKLHVADASAATGIRVTGAGSGHTASRLIMESTGSADYRGQGVFMVDTAGGQQWYAGTPYADTDQYIIARAGSGTFDDATAQTSNAIAIVSTIGLRTPSAWVGAGGTPAGSYSYNYARSSLAPSGYIWSTMASGGGSSNLYLHRHDTSQNFVSFGYGLNGIGSISTNGSSVAYNTTSDYRLKENIRPINDALDRLMGLKPSRFSFKNDEKHELVDGFLAHEVEELAPYAVVGEKDAVDEEGKPVYQQLDYGKLTPLLTGAVKELKAENDNLRAIVVEQGREIETIKARLDAGDGE